MKRVIGIAVALAGVASVLAVTGAEAQTTVRVGWCARTISSAAAPFAIATKLGWYEKMGVKVELVPLPGSGDCAKFVATGETLIALPSVEPVAVMRAQGAKLKTFYTAYQGNIYGIAVPVDSPIRSLADLRGKTIGLHYDDPELFQFARAALIGAGVDPEREVRFMPLPGSPLDAPRMAACLRANEVQAVWQLDVLEGFLEGEGLPVRRLPAPMIDRLTPSSCLETLDAHLEARPDAYGAVGRAVAKHPSRFVGFFMLDPTAADAPATAEHAIETLGLRTICLFPAMQRYSLHDPGVRAVFGVAARHPGAAVFVHCGALSVGVRKKLGLPSRFDVRFGNPLDLHALAADHPGVPVIIPHFGAGLFREALLVADLCPNVYLDTSSSNSWRRYEGLELETIFRRALDVAGPGRLLFGTDSSFFPRGWNHEIFEAQSRVLDRIGLNPGDVRKILGENLDHLFS